VTAPRHSRSAAGYADQAHLTREGARLAGLPPAALTAARRPATAWVLACLGRGRREPETLAVRDG